MSEIEVKTYKHTMSVDPHGSAGPGVYCTCGARKLHTRGKVLSKWVNRHSQKTGHQFRRSDG